MPPLFKRSPGARLKKPFLRRIFLPLFLAAILTGGPWQGPSLSAPLLRALSVRIFPVWAAPLFAKPLPLKKCKEYAILAKGVTEDLKSRLYWMRCTAGEKATPGLCSGTARPMDWYAARDFCKNLHLYGRRWRLPTVQELQSLLYLGKSGPPFIQTDYFSMSTRAEYWSQNPRTDTKGLLFDYINFEDGGRYSAPPSARLFVRCVSDPSASRTKIGKISKAGGCSLR